MAGVFISHSSKDKVFARRLQRDLANMGYETWLDEKNIGVGDSIVDKINDGLGDADYVVLVLSRNSIESEWVKREWQSAYMTETERKQPFLLPVCIDDCEVPQLLKAKKYADMSDENYAVGLVELVSSISPMIKSRESKVNLSVLREHDHSSQFGEILSELYILAIPLSATIAKTLVLAEKNGKNSLAQFCRNELAGWTDESIDPEEITHRQVLVFLSPWKANFQYIGWNQNASALIEHVKEREYSIQSKYFFNYPISKVEELARRASDENGVIFFETDASVIVPDAKPGIKLFGYARGTAYFDMLEATRSELAKRLMAEIPSAS
ncbi:toll/interleukin-1 receptor domain-containing protein [Alicyclobacillus tolerans]|uniref:toll/interleukin-1 receptor domain-containing protein n=1 Tax=Alicyclobacillus tolerans TaxID=90970 RepID=UPI003B761E9A